MRDLFKKSFIYKTCLLKYYENDKYNKNVTQNF